MTPAEAITILRHYSEWQKSNGSTLRMHSTKEINKAIDAAVEMIERLEAAEKERDTLRAENEALAANLRGKHSTAGATYTHLIAERDALRAEVQTWQDQAKAYWSKIEQMERQEPVKHEFQGRDGTWHSFIDQRHYENTVADGTWPIRALYALPGAQTQGEGK